MGAGKFIFKGYNFFSLMCCYNSRTAVSLWGEKWHSSGCHLSSPITNYRNKLVQRLNDKYYEFQTNLNLTFFSARMLKKSFKTFDNRVIAHLERWYDFRDYNDLRNTEPFASQKLFRFEDLFITALKVPFTSSFDASGLHYAWSCHESCSATITTGLLYLQVL